MGAYRNRKHLIRQQDGRKQRSQHDHATGAFARAPWAHTEIAKKQSASRLGAYRSRKKIIRQQDVRKQRSQHVHVGGLFFAILLF